MMRRIRWKRWAIRAAACGEGENRKVLDGVMESIGVSESQKLTVLRAIDKARPTWNEGVDFATTVGKMKAATSQGAACPKPNDRIMLYVTA